MIENPFVAFCRSIERPSIDSEVAESSSNQTPSLVALQPLKGLSLYIDAVRKQ